MKRILSFVLAFQCSMILFAQQTPDAKTLQETGKTFMRQGDYTNALLSFNKALQQKPNDLEILKDIVFNYYLSHDYSKALEVGKPLPERPDADVQSYQLLGMVYKAIEERKDCEKLYKKGIKAFPNSGVLYSEYGEMLWTKQDYSAIKLWEKGIEVDKNYSGNYYNAAKYYYFTKDKVWGLIYGEIFLDLESYSRRTEEIKKLVLEGYKKLFVEQNLTKDQDMKNEFVKAYLEVMSHQTDIAANGITAETLTMIRTKFLLEWMDKKALSFPFKLFDYQQQLLKGGMFDAYNQWLFGAAQNLTTFQSWTTTHAAEYEKFTSFQKGRVFKLADHQYYQTKKD
ncbi:tetratricopeptide repeat protein [Pinibacter aurantiacus]|uniref:Tetratricopeptide repeat protein n=1 Tax=Pinibacter aurantiacus TaxID=2851599 RepID=A0A9E2S7C1_9BACT|nr:tetratricopeptide repeat protein [Pinibacter aurantiacus]MBV4356227.1 tetratricopeptide repeat protein [Pinibacter aurantiacus]